MHRMHAGAIRGVEVLTGIGLETLQTPLPTKVVGLPLVLDTASRAGRIDAHATDDVGLHTVYS